MDEKSLFQLDQATVVIVPTGSLATHLNETIAVQQIERGVDVWEAPNIVSWSELLRTLWQVNRASVPDVHNVLGNQQSKMLWTQAIEKSKYNHSELTLLNVPQTVRACMRSDKLLSDWAGDESALRLDHVSDVDQFLAWRDDYLQSLLERRVADEPSLQRQIVGLAEAGRLTYPFEKFVWYAYDLVTASQRQFSAAAKCAGCSVSMAGPGVGKAKQTFRKYQTAKLELESVFVNARQLLEQNEDLNIHVVIPDLQHRYSQVQEMARKVFYPNASLTEIQNNHSVYRLSLGKPLHEWPAIESALCVMSLLSGQLSTNDLSFLFRSVYFNSTQTFRNEFRVLDQWLRSKRTRSVSLESLPALLSECSDAENDSASVEVVLPTLINFIEQLIAFRVDIDQRLKAQKERTGYQALTFVEWADVFSQWLSCWGWQAYAVEGEHSSLAYQLKKRWDRVLEEFSGLGAVQRQIGMKSALSHFQQLVRDSVFLPQSAVSPIVISGLLEALGKEIQVCFLTGMTQDYPAPNKGDAFIPNHHLLPTGYPNASAQASFAQARRVVHNLLASTEESYISFAETTVSHQETPNQASSLFTSEFSKAPLIEFEDVCSDTPQTSILEAYVDDVGPPWPPSRKVRGGASIFKNQSQCAFKAFATHQLGFDVEDDPEFGLDHLDRGNLTHKMLELVWEQLPDQKALLAMNASEQTGFLENTFERLIELSRNKLSSDKIRLLQFERQRVIDLTSEWLELERNRPSNFSVVERESKSKAEWAGIKFEYIVDRVDITEAGQCVIVDYKTGTAARGDWLGERPNEPQLPLYTVVRDQAKLNKVAGIAFGQIRRSESKFVELADVDIFQIGNKRTAAVEQEWLESRERWPEILTGLAEDFLAGNAEVNPVDKVACQYCELSSVCRIEELRQNSKAASIIAGDDEL